MTDEKRVVPAETQTGVSAKSLRPRTWPGDEKIEEMLEHISGGKSLTSWCKANGVTVPAVWRWCEEDIAGLAERYTRARQRQALTWADEVVTLADEAKGEGSDAIQAAKLRVETRKWVLSRILRPIFGDTPTNAIAVGGDNITITVKE